MLTRAYSILDIKSVDDEQRIIEGIATTPSTDRMGDVVEPKGAQFSLPIPLLWQHQADQPIGKVLSATVTKNGIAIKAQIAKGVLPRIDEAWALMKAGLVRGLSIGFKAIETAQIDGTFGIRFLKWDWLELSAVTIPANADASVTAIKSFDAPFLAASGGAGAPPYTTPGATGTCVVKVDPSTRKVAMKTVSEQIKDFEATRAAKSARMTEIMQKSAEAGTTLDESQAQEYDGLEAEVKSVDAHIARLRSLEASQAKAAVPVSGHTVAAAATTRGGSPVISVSDNLPPGIGFARAVMCQLTARLDNVSAMEVAKARYPDHGALHNFLTYKGAIPAGTTTQADYASSLVYATNLASEFIDFLRPQTILGKFGQGGVPSLTRIPFNVRVPSQTSGSDGFWVGEGAPAPLTSFATSSVSLTYSKLASIAVITKELARFSTPSAEMLVRNELAKALIERADIDFVDPAKAISANVSPASITNGLVALTSAGTSADNARTDVISLLVPFLEAHYNAAGLVLIMPNTLALALSLLRNSLGQKEFPDITANGGFLEGLPVITSQYAANVSGGGNLVVAVSAPDIYLADDGSVTVEASQEASLQMLDNPTNNSATATATTMVSMFQTDSIALKAMREINWKKRRTDAVVYMDDVNWGSVGSPA